MGTLTTGNIKAGALESSDSPASNTHITFANTTVTTYDSTAYAAGGQEIETFDFTENGLNVGEAFVYEKSGAGKLQGYPGICIVSEGATNGSQVFADRGPSRHSVSATNHMHHDSGGGIFLNNPTSIHTDGDDLLTIPYHDDFGHFGWEDFTLEYWIHPYQDQGSNDMICQVYDPTSGVHYDDWSNSWTTTTTSWGLRIGNTVIAAYTCTFSLSADKWWHIAWERQGPHFRCFINGEEQPLAADGATTPGVLTYLPKVPNNPPLTIAKGYYASRHGDFYIDDFRIIKGKAIYNSNFEPPSRSPKDTRAYGDVADYTKITVMGYRSDTSSYFTAINYIAGNEVVARDYMGISHNQLQATAYSGATQKIMIFNNSTNTVKFTAYVETTT